MILRVKYQTWQGPEIALEFLRIVPTYAHIFVYTDCGGNVEGINELFKKGQASPRDIRSSDMATPLQVSISMSIASWVTSTEILNIECRGQKVLASSGISGPLCRA